MGPQREKLLEDLDKCATIASAMIGQGITNNGKNYGLLRVFHTFQEGSSQDLRLLRSLTSLPPVHQLTNQVEFCILYCTSIFCTFISKTTRKIRSSDPQYIVLDSKDLHNMGPIIYVVREHFNRSNRIVSDSQSRNVIAILAKFKYLKSKLSKQCDI